MSSRELFYLIVLFVVGRVDFQVSNIVIEIFQVWNFRKILEKFYPCYPNTVFLSRFRNKISKISFKYDKVYILKI